MTSGPASPVADALPPWTIQRAGAGPLLASAIHQGHELRAEVAALTALDQDERLREEDPFTAEWTTIAPVRVVVHRSRFEVDLNDGMFLVALDIVGDKLMEVNVFSPGGLGSVLKTTGVEFCSVVVDALERKIAFKRAYGSNINNNAIATL